MVIYYEGVILHFIKIYKHKYTYVYNNIYPIHIYISFKHLN